MENEDKDKKVILTDEELKDVTGGVVTDVYCNRHKDPKSCNEEKICKWYVKKCVSAIRGY
jgi:hypothetical protein